jgi:two-component system LytT family response regulator
MDCWWQEPRTGFIQFVYVFLKVKSMDNNPVYTAIIVDDEAPARSIIRQYLGRHANVEVIGECANGFDAIKMVRDLNPNLMFLDIQMPKVSGLELLEVLEDAPQVIFTTAYDEYALKAFELNAVDYLLKPFSLERFDAALNKALERLAGGLPAQRPPVEEIRNENPEKLNRIVVKKGSSISVIPVSDILFLEAQEEYVMIYSGQGRFMKHQTMHYYESHLPENEFVRIHRSYIANITKISKLEPYDKDSYIAVMPPDHRLRISRTGYRKLREKLGF